MALDILFKGFGIIGLILIIIGVLLSKEEREDVFFLFGGIFLLGYSTYIRDAIFIILQSVFIAASGYELIKLSKKK